MATSKRGTGRRGSGQEDSGLTNVFLVLLLFAVLMLLIVYFSNEKKEEEVDNTITPTLQASAGSEDKKGEGKTPEEGNAGTGTEPKGENPTEADQSGENRGDSANNTDAADRTDDNNTNNNTDNNSGNPGEVGQNVTSSPIGNEPEEAEPTKAESQEGDETPAATQTPVPTPTPVPEPTDDLEQDYLMTREEAEDILAGEIREKGYSYQLSDENMELDGKQYFCYKIFHQQQEENYSVLVDKENGNLFHYDGSSRTEFQGVGYYAENIAPGDAATEGMTEEKAKQLLSGLSPSSMLLPAPLDECRLSLDDWQTVVGSDECYCLNVFYEGTLAGSIYFTEDGEKVYYLDEFGEFVRVK